MAESYLTSLNGRVARYQFPFNDDEATHYLNDCVWPVFSMDKKGRAFEVHLGKKFLHIRFSGKPYPKSRGKKAYYIKEIPKGKYKTFVGASKINGKESEKYMIPNTHLDELDSIWDLFFTRWQKGRPVVVTVNADSGSLTLEFFGKPFPKPPPPKIKPLPKPEQEEPKKEVPKKKKGKTFKLRLK